MDGEVLAYAAMKQALEDIVALKDSKPWEADLDKAVDIAKAALECEARLGDGA
jgi:hypothetical protein